MPKIELLTLYQEEKPNGQGLKKIRVENRPQWEKKREQITKRLLHVMGRFPATNPAVRFTSLSEEFLNGYVRKKIRYESGNGDEVTAWLLIPRVRTKKRPAVMALHPTASGAKDVVVGIGHTPGRNYGEELARRGYVVLAPDVLSAGERVLPGSESYETAHFDRRNPEWSMMGKMTWDHMRGVDVLISLPEVDAQKIGTIGHSLGGYNAIWLAAFDSRIKAAVSSCGWASVGGAPDPFALSRNSWFVHFPKLRLYLSAGITPFDFHEVVALIAPRPFFNHSAKQDRFFPNWQDIAAASDEVRAVYDFYQSETNYQFLLGEGEHDFPEPARRQAYAFLDRHLGND